MCACVNAQKSKPFLKTIDSFSFYGVDYSHVTVHAATESPAKFREAFVAINKLLLVEANKYDVSKFARKPVTLSEVIGVCELAEQMADSFITFSAIRMLTDAEVEQAVQTLTVKSGSGVGMVMVAELLDKPQKRGVFRAVFFDTETRKVLCSRRIEGEAGGFGLRNYWANSVREAMHDLKRI